jgi:glycosyltransferase involved in cell wall biosynthesis
MSSIDVVVPCYNYGRYLSQCVRSVLSSEGPETRVLIIDDCSSDDSAEIAAALAESDHRIGLRRHTVNQGHIKTYNEGLDWASSDYLLLLSADDWVLPGALGRAVEVLDADPSVGFVWGPALFVRDGQPTEPDEPPRPGWHVISGIEFLYSIAYRNIVHTCTAVVRTSVQKQVGGYLETLPHAGDLEMWMRIALHARVGYVNACQGVYRQHVSNMSTAYYRRMIADFEQRKIVLDTLFNNYPRQLEGLYDMLWGKLAEATMHAANDPFKRGDIEQFDELRNFASCVYPPICKSRHWRLQTTKRVVGPKLWSYLRLAASPLGVLHPGGST